MKQDITPCLWFDGQAEEAAGFYTTLFPDSKITAVTHYGKAGPLPEGTVLTVTFQLGDREFMALNGGPEFQFSEAVSFVVPCETQEEIDRYWSALSEGGEIQECGWLKDRFGLSWQIVPSSLDGMISDPDPAKSERVMQALLQMKKLDMALLEQAYRGSP